MRTIWPLPGDGAVGVIDQRRLPHHVETPTLRTVAETVSAIAEMIVRGAPLIGVTAAYGLALQADHDAGDAALQAAGQALKAARPTAVNLSWAVDRAMQVIRSSPAADRSRAAWDFAARLADEDVATNAAIGEHGLRLLRTLLPRQPGQLNILTHCNAGWLATVDWGTALAPIYKAHAAGLPVHVWVDETRPRNQGASLTAFELREEGIAHTVIADNAGGHLMQHGLVDAVIVGCDRVTARGDVCNKIGTYLKALAAHDNGVPFYVALPTPTIDWTLQDGVREIPIEERAQEEVTHIAGLCGDGQVRTVQVTPQGSPAANYGFDVTPARLVTGLITERGVVKADAGAMRALK
jgi:methylthioribose-1-phosphate isomerase